MFSWSKEAVKAKHNTVMFCCIIHAPAFASALLERDKDPDHTFRQFVHVTTGKLGRSGTVTYFGAGWETRIQLGQFQARRVDQTPDLDRFHFFVPGGLDMLFQGTHPCFLIESAHTLETLLCGARPAFNPSHVTRY